MMRRFDKSKMKGFWMFCAQCKLYAYTPADAREHQIKIHKQPRRYVDAWWPDEVEA